MHLVFSDITLDHAIRVNETLRITCSLFNSTIIYKNHTYSVSSKDLILKFESEYLQDLNILDNFSIEYVVENAQEYDSGGYSCYITLPERNQNVLVCSTSVAVGCKYILLSCV